METTSSTPTAGPIFVTVVREMIGSVVVAAPMSLVVHSVTTTCVAAVGETCSTDAPAATSLAVARLPTCIAGTVKMCES